MNPNPTIAIVGATGAVGREMLAVLEQRDFPHREVRVLASERSAGSKLPYRGRQLTVEPLTEDAFGGVDIALFSAGSGPSKRFAPVAAAAGTIVIDNSSAFRMDPDVPLVIPEINPEALEQTAPKEGRGRIIANPNCSAIILLMALTPLRRAFGIERIVVATYQAASGAGAKAMEELEAQTRDVLAGKEPRPQVFHEPYAFNLFCHNAAVDPLTGLNGEEAKMIAEGRKIWSDPGLRLTAMCVRVPVMRAHAQAVNVTLSRPATTAQIREALAAFPGVKVLDDRENNRFPTPLKASGGDDVLVGRIRPDPSQMPQIQIDQSPDETPSIGFDLFVCGDQLRKGAALNAVQIAELFLPSRQTR